VIKWCAYCLHYICECEPYHEFDITHGVCRDCIPRLLTLTEADQEALKPLKAFFHALQKGVHEDQVADVTAVLEDSRRLGIRPIDLMMGLLQPMLTEIGELWSRGEVTVALEHRFSAMARSLTAHFRSQLQVEAPAATPALLLFSASDNLHNLGLEMAEFFFAISGIPALVTYSPLPADEVLDLIRQYAPVTVGFSVALPGQMKLVTDLVAAARKLPRPPRHFVVGGPAVRGGLALDPAWGIQACRDLAEVQAFL